MSFQYGFSYDGEEVTFRSDDKKVLKDVVDYITRYIDAERYRREPKQTTIHQVEKTKRY